jgi:hypothetical protein
VMPLKQKNTTAHFDYREGKLEPPNFFNLPSRN